MKAILYIAKAVILFFSLSILMSACSVNKPATVNYQPSFDFSSIKSYRFFDRNSAFSDYQNVGDSTRNSIEFAIEKAMDKQGYSYQEERQADVIVAYHLIGNIKELFVYNKGVKYCRPCLHAGQVTINKHKASSVPGSLVLDLIHHHEKRSVWRGVYPLKIKHDDNSVEQQDKIEHAIAKMLKEIPKR